MVYNETRSYNELQLPQKKKKKIKQLSNWHPTEYSIFLVSQHLGYAIRHSDCNKAVAILAGTSSAING